MPIQPQIQEQENIPPQEISQQPEQDLLSQKLDVQPQEEEINNNNEEQEVPPVEQEPETKKFSFNDLGENIVLIPPGYSTDDEGEYKLINLLNEPKEKYKLAVESKYAQIYKREVSKILIFNINLNLFIITQGENNIQILKTYGKVPFPLSKIRPVLQDTPGMDNWDKTFKKHEVIQKFPTENGMDREIDYLYIKMPVFMTDRELVMEKKVWSEYNGNPKIYQYIKEV